MSDSQTSFGIWLDDAGHERVEAGGGLKIRDDHGRSFLVLPGGEKGDGDPDEQASEAHHWWHQVVLAQ